MQYDAGIVHFNAGIEHYSAGIVYFYAGIQHYNEDNSDNKFRIVQISASIVNFSAFIVTIRKSYKIHGIFFTSPVF